MGRWMQKKIVSTTTADETATRTRQINLTADVGNSNAAVWRIVVGTRSTRSRCNNSDSKLIHDGVQHCSHSQQQLKLTSQMEYEHQVPVASNTQHFIMLAVSLGSTSRRRNGCSSSVLLHSSSMGSSLHNNSFSCSSRGVYICMAAPLDQHLSELKTESKIHSSLRVSGHKSAIRGSQKKVPAGSWSSSKCDTTLSLLTNMHVTQAGTIGS